jgi:DNA-binding response OmpR family regulator
MAFTARILIADDDDKVLKSTAVLLREAGYICDSVQDGESAVALISEREFNLMVTDIRMPGNTELQLVKKATELEPGLPVILMTAYPTVESAIIAIELPVFAYVQKPFEGEEMLSKVRGAVKWNQAYKAIKSAEQHLAESVANTSQIQGMMAASKQGTLEARVQSFFSQTLGSMAAAMMDLNLLFQALQVDPRPEAACTILDCPHTKVIEDALADAVAILRDTKDKFRSKELAALRRKLENLLEDQRRNFRATEGSSLI